jgi:outer membrane protein assembly factor BamE (lipoprotein component of BamABCDE complex)
MAELKTILVLKNEIEAQVLSEALHARGIPHMVRSYHDSAYDGLFQMQKGWGALLGPDDRRDEILQIYDSLG